MSTTTTENNKPVTLDTNFRTRGRLNSVVEQIKKELEESELFTMYKNLYTFEFKENVPGYMDNLMMFTTIMKDKNGKILCQYERHISRVDSSSLRLATVNTDTSHATTMRMNYQESIINSVSSVISHIVTGTITSVAISIDSYGTRTV